MFYLLEASHYIFLKEMCHSVKLLFFECFCWNIFKYRDFIYVFLFFTRGMLMPGTMLEIFYGAVHRRQPLELGYANFDLELN